MYAYVVGKIRILISSITTSNAHLKIRLLFSEKMFSHRYKEQKNSVDGR